MNMKSNKAGTPAIPSPAFTYATTYTVPPRPSPLLSSSFTPFYPRSQQQIYPTQLDPSGNHDAGCYVSPQDFSDVCKSHLYEWSQVGDPKLYDQQCYASSGSEPYEASWVSNNGDVWGVGTWQAGNLVPEEYIYSDNEAEDSAYLHPDSLSYYVQPPGMEHEFPSYACCTSNTTSVPTVYSDPVATSLKVSHDSFKLEHAGHFSNAKESLAPGLKISFVQDQANPYCAFGEKGPAKRMSNEVANAFSSAKLDARPFSIQVSSQMCSSVGIVSQAVEPQMKQATTDMIENKSALTDSSKLPGKSCCNSSDESLEAIELKKLIQATSSPTQTLELLEGINLDAPTASVSAEGSQKEAYSRNNLSLQSSSNQLLSTNGQCPDMTIPKHINTQTHYSSLIETAPLEQKNMGSLLNKDSLVMEIEGKPCVKAIDHEARHQDKMGSGHSVSGNAWLYLNRPQLLVKCIHNLSKVLLSSQSGSSLNILDPNDCFAIENTICILSHRLSQLSINETNFCRGQRFHQVAEQGPKIYNDTFKIDEEAGRGTFQQKSSSLLKSMKPKAKTVLENEALDGWSKVTSSTCVGGDERAYQSSFVKQELEKPLEDLLMLQCNIRNLQEEVAYERAESNATVTTYKKLWSEAQEALKVSRSEIKELRAEIAILQQHFTNMKHSGGMPTDLELIAYDKNTSFVNKGGLHENLLDVKTGSSQCFTAQGLCSAQSDDICGAFCGSSKETFPACSEVVKGDFASENISNCRENWTPYAGGENLILRHNHESDTRFEIASEPSSKQVNGAATNLEDEVTRRLCLLLARQGLDLNKTRIDRDVELTSGFNVLLEVSSDLSSKGEAMPPDKKGNQLIWSETSYMANANKGIGDVEADLRLQMKTSFEMNYGDHSLVERQSNTPSVDAGDVNVSTCQEDEIEIICLKPGVAESSFTCLKGEPEWEHVVVNALDDQETTRQGNPPRRVHR